MEKGPFSSSSLFLDRFISLPYMVIFSMLEDMECYVAIPMCKRTRQMIFSVSHLCGFFQVYINSAIDFLLLKRSVPLTARMSQEVSKRLVNGL